MPNIGINRFVFVSKETVKEIHDCLVVGAQGFNNESNFEFMFSQIEDYLRAEEIESRNFRESIVCIASYYLFHLAAGHCFNDGNKRTAFITASTFFVLNGKMAKYDEEKVDKYLKEVNEKMWKGGKIADAMHELEAKIGKADEFRLIQLLFDLAGARGPAYYSSVEEIFAAVDELVAEKENGAKKGKEQWLSKISKNIGALFEKQKQ